MTRSSNSRRRPLPLQSSGAVRRQGDRPVPQAPSRSPTLSPREEALCAVASVPIVFGMIALVYGLAELLVALGATL